MDPIADLLTIIRNGQKVRKDHISLPYSNMKIAIAKILKEEGFLNDIEVSNEPGERKGKFKVLNLTLKYLPDGEGAIRHLKRVSTPGRRIYSGRKKLPRILNGLGVAIISTPRGLMTNREARKRHLGGEVICEVY